MTAPTTAAFWLSCATCAPDPAHRQMHDGITAAEYAAALTVLRRVMDNLGEDSDLP